MNKQSQWLFEAPAITVPPSDQEHYSKSEWEAEWELQEMNPYVMGEQEWETVGSFRVPRRVARQPRATSGRRYSGTQLNPRRVPGGQGNTHPPASPTVLKILTYTTREVIDSRISVPAQYSLVRLSKNLATNADAVGMLNAVKTGRLAGISCVNWEKAALRAKSLGKSWSTVIPPGKDAALLPDPKNPSSGSPMIVFRRNLDPDCGLLPGEARFQAPPQRLDTALIRIWREYLNSQQSSGLIHDRLLGYLWPSTAQHVYKADYEADYEVIPPDDRIFVKNTHNLPFRWICHLNITVFHPEGDRDGVGTGILISPYHVLTAAHNLIHPQFGSAKKILVTPAFNLKSSSSRPMGVFKVKNWRTSRVWANSVNDKKDDEIREFDYGLITLKTAVGAFWGSKGGNTRIVEQFPNTLKGVTVNTAGYPNDKCLDQPPASLCQLPPSSPCNQRKNFPLIGTTQWQASGNVIDPPAAVPFKGPRLIFYTNDACRGQSGSPVWTTSNKIHTLVAIHVAGHYTGGPGTGVANVGVRLTKELLNEVREWIKEDNVTPSF